MCHVARDPSETLKIAGLIAIERRGVGDVNATNDDIGEQGSDGPTGHRIERLERGCQCLDVPDRE